MRLDHWVPFFAAILLLTVPLNWLLAAAAAALVHELCHVLAILILGGRILGIHIGLRGAAIEAEISHGWQEMLSALAGPAGSFCLLFVCHMAPKLALCGLFQGLFNLLPIYPMDGGRVLSCFLHRYFPLSADRILRAVEFTLMGILCSITLYVCGRGILPPVFAYWMLLLLFRLIFRKIPCKPGQSKVQ